MLDTNEQVCMEKALALHRGGALQEAERIYAECLSLNPEHFDAKHMLGVLHLQRGEFTVARGLLSEAVRLNPASAAVLNNLGLCQLELGQVDEAVASFSAAVRLNPAFDRAYGNLGNALRRLGRRREATEVYTKALSLNPRSRANLLNMGIALLDGERYSEALRCFDESASLGERSHALLLNRGAALMKLQRSDEALQAINDALSISPSAEAFCNRGGVLHQLGRLDEALADFAEAIALKPTLVLAHIGQGTIHEECNRIEAARDSYEAALLVSPSSAQALYCLSNITSFVPDDPRLALMEAVYQSGSIAGSDRALICFALAKAYEDTRQIESAYKFVALGNALQRNERAYDPAVDRQWFASLRSTADTLSLLSGHGTQMEPTLVPVFIVGMPRSGTTLVEQVLSCHGEVEAGGELEHIHRIGGELATGRRQITRASLGAFRARYLQQISRLARGRRYLTDKMPRNFQYIPLICAAFPEAKIIHVRRDARAVCWSNYRHHFTARNMGYSNDLGDTVAYFKLYEELMMAWEKNWSTRIHHLDYEAFCSNPDAGIRSLLAHLDLPLDPACLTPERNGRMVQTASRHQVRKAIYKDSSEQWRGFESFIGDAFKEL